MTPRDLVLQRLAYAADCSLFRRGVDERFVEKNWESFQGLEPQVKLAQDTIKRGDSLTLSGPKGTGKTHMAVACIRTWLRYMAGKLVPELEYVSGWFDESNADQWIFDHPHILPYFISAPEFFLELKATFNNSEYTERDVLDRYTSSKALLVLDDLGAEKVSDWSRQMLFTLIDRRYRRMQQTIVTTNLSLDELAAHYDARVPDRLLEMGTIINLGGESYRVKQTRMQLMDNASSVRVRRSAKRFARI